jgi:hypothetical protein
MSATTADGQQIITYRGPTFRHANGWHAVTEDYDGAPDARGPSTAIGFGSTEEEAIANLLDELEEMQS